MPKPQGGTSERNVLKMNYRLPQTNTKQEQEKALNEAHQVGFIHGMFTTLAIIALAVVTYLFLAQKNYEPSLYNIETVLVDMVQVRDKTTGELIDEYRP